MTTFTLSTVVLLTALAYLVTLSGIALFWAIRVGGRRDDVADHFAAPSVSRFTIPVSLIVPVGSDVLRLRRTVEALLNLNYPEFEIIAVYDSARADATRALAGWELEPKEFFYRQSIATEAVRRIYRSRRDPRVIVVDKETASAADAFNCGVNIARYRYVCSVDPALTFDPQALMRLMTAPLRDPGHVIGASNHIERLDVFERPGSARAIMASRLLWRRLGRGLAAASSICVWRRDVVLDAGGFSSKAFDPALDLARRVVMTPGDGLGRFVRGAEVFGSISTGRHASFGDRARRLAGACQALALLSPAGVRSLGIASVAAFFGSELVTPLIRLVAFALLAGGALAGTLSWPLAALSALLLCFAHATVTNAALLVRGQAPAAPEEPELRRLIVSGLGELLIRPFRV